MRVVEQCQSTPTLKRSGPPSMYSDGLLPPLMPCLVNRRVCRPLGTDPRRPQQPEARVLQPQSKSTSEESTFVDSVFWTQCREDHRLRNGSVRRGAIRQKKNFQLTEYFQPQMDTSCITLSFSLFIPQHKKRNQILKIQKLFMTQCLPMSPPPGRLNCPVSGTVLVCSSSIQEKLYPEFS